MPACCAHDLRVGIAPLTFIQVYDNQRIHSGVQRTPHSIEVWDNHLIRLDTVEKACVTASL